MKTDFIGQTAVVFGGSRGIGKAIAKELVEAGAYVYIASHNEANAQATKTELVKAGYQATAAAVDVVDYNQVEDFLKLAKTRIGRLDIIINNAVIVGTTPFLDASQDEIKRLLAVDLMGVNNGCQAGIKLMEGQNGGKIVNISSFAGHRAMRAGFAHYGMTKSA